MNPERLSAPTHSTRTSSSRSLQSAHHMEGSAARRRESSRSRRLAATSPTSRSRSRRSWRTELQAAHPDIRTYAGTSADGTATIRLDVTPLGFHASVIGRNGTTTSTRPTSATPASTSPTRAATLPPAGAPGRARARSVPWHRRANVRTEGRPPGEPARAPVKSWSQRTYRLALLTDMSYARGLLGARPQRRHPRRRVERRGARRQGDPGQPRQPDLQPRTSPSGSSWSTTPRPGSNLQPRGSPDGGRPP